MWQHSTAQQLCVRAVVAAAAACLLVQPAASYPSYWTTYHAAGSANCLAHPKQAYQEHGYSDAPDTKTVITVLHGSTGAPIAGGALVCAGETYTIKVPFSKASHYLLTASQGSFSKPCDNDCPNRVCPGSSTTLTAQSLTLSCSASGPVAIAVSHASSASATIQTATLQLQVDPSCPQPAACGGSGGATSPSPSPSVAQPSPSPKPSSPSPAPSASPSPGNTRSINLRRSSAKPLSLSSAEQGVAITATLSGPAAWRRNKTLKVTTSKQLKCGTPQSPGSGSGGVPLTVVTDATGQATFDCFPVAAGSGRVQVSLSLLKARTVVTVTV